MPNDIQRLGLDPAEWETNVLQFSWAMCSFYVRSGDCFPLIAEPALTHFVHTRRRWPEMTLLNRFPGCGQRFVQVAVGRIIAFVVFKPVDNGSLR